MKNTLGKEITKEFFFDKKNGYELLEAHWKELIKSGFKPDATQILFYQVLRGKDWTKSFTPISNQNKINNGGWFNCGIYHSLTRIHSSFYLKNLSLFGDILSEEVVDLVRSYLPKVNDYNADLIEQVAYPGVKNVLSR